MYYQGRLSHGTCVGLGMLFAAHLGNSMKFSTCKLLEIHLHLLEKLGISMDLLRDIDVKVLLEIMSHDKKRFNGKIRFIFLEDVGRIKRFGENFYYSMTDLALAESVSAFLSSIGH
jgi:3-dehydroquinate synthase